jgi:hypothetical protein
MNPLPLAAGQRFSSYWLVLRFDVLNVPEGATVTVRSGGGNASARASGGLAKLRGLRGRRLQFGTTLTISATHPRYFRCTIKEKILSARRRMHQIVSKNC